ncbi:ArnT family glycosyltransferase [Ferruginibacter sp.]
MKHIKLIWVIIFLLGVGVRSTKLIHAVDTESWREGDMSTIAKNFYEKKTDILHPQIAWDGSGPGYTEGEFQIYTYLIATSYKIFGFWEPTGRVISFIFSILTMLVFVKLCRYLMDEKEALAAFFFFAVSPILMVMANAIQPESTMFFFYVCAGYTFLRWLDSASQKYFWLAVVSTALALLCKVTSANIGLMFLIMMIYKKGWKFLFKPQLILFGVLTVLPAALWYYYCHKFYLQYGNSLGLSNEYAWIGMDFFTSPRFILGIIHNEDHHVWTKAGPFIAILGLLFTDLRKKESTVLSIAWLTAALAFYLMAVRTTSDDWAYYYHIFSIPAAAILMGSAVVALYNRYMPVLKAGANKALAVKGWLIMGAFALLSCYFLLATGKYALKIKPLSFQTSEYYSCKDSLAQLVPQGSMILTNGGLCSDYQGRPKAYNNPYFFYWLNRKGYNICVGDLSFNNIKAYKAKGVEFFLAERKVIKDIPGFEDELRHNLTPVFECNGCILFKL